MTRLEVKELIDIITIHRPYFVSRLGDNILNNMMKEWERIMGPYDFEDIKNNLETFLKNENNYGKDPDAYQLIRGLLTTEDKETNSLGRVACMFCGRWFNRLEIYYHEARCRSIKHIEREYRKYLNRELADKIELYRMTDEEFDERYIKALEFLLPHMTDEERIRDTKKAIETYYEEKKKTKENEK